MSGQLGPITPEMDDEQFLGLILDDLIQSCQA